MSYILLTQRCLITSSESNPYSIFTFFSFLRIKREYETSRIEQLVSRAHPDRRPVLVHQPVFCPHWCYPATGGSAISCLSQLHSLQQTQPAPQHRLNTTFFPSNLIYVTECLLNFLLQNYVAVMTSMC